MILKHSPALKHASPRDAGLFHTAILFDTEEALAASVYSVATRHPKTFTGSSDHLVSKAFYFTDPEGNGVELCWDRDRTEWSWTHGSVEMATLFLDPNGFLQENLTESAVFVSAGRYHHHMAMNTWNSSGDTLIFGDPWANQIRVTTAAK